MKLYSPLIKTVAVSSAKKIHKAVEFCGHHPFVTGLFAILSLVGLFLSVWGYSLDRKDAISTTIQVQRVEGKIDQIINKEKQEIDLDKLLSFSSIHDNSDSYIHIGASSKDSLEWIEKNTKKIPTWLFWGFTITSNAQKYFVQLAPYLLIDIVNVRPMPKDIVAVYKGERGAGEIIRLFKAVLRPKVGLIPAPHINDDNGEFPKYDYYSLTPGESEIYMISIDYESGFIYQFRIGIQYRYRGKDIVKWLPKTYEAGTPADPVNIVYSFQDRWAKEMHPDHNSQNHIAEVSKKYKTFMSKTKLFNINQIEK